VCKEKPMELIPGQSEGKSDESLSNAELLNEFVRYKYVVDNIKEVIWEVDTDAVFAFISPTIKGMTGYEVEQMIGRSILEFLTEDSRRFLMHDLDKPERKKITTPPPLYDIEFICKDGRTIWCEVSVKPVFQDGALVCYVGTSRDISEKKLYEKKLHEMLEAQMQINKQLEDMLTYDMLTGAYNRRKFEYFVHQEIEKAERYENPFSITIFDVDNFKQINDVSGHNNGDRVLQEIAAIIKHTLRDSDKLFRWGGDEFIVLLPDVNLKNAFKVANKIRKAIDSYAFDIEGKCVSLSLGVGTYDTNETLDQFIARVDKALLKAKNNGKNLVEQG
jgi:diguanylate cyclase (GGDEF)-like protein/PAS domain S-box-containing protein